jgi:hypothetical protein
MDRKSQVTKNKRGAPQVGFAIRRIIILLLLAGLISACGTATPPATENPPITEAPPVTEAPPEPAEPVVTEESTATIPVELECTFGQEQVVDYVVWFEEDDPQAALTCNKGVAVATSPDLPVNRVRDLPYGSPAGNQENFTLLREVINVELVDADGDTLTSFDPPIRLYLAYTQADLDNALKEAGDDDDTENAENLLAFAFLDDNQVWVKFEPDKHGYSLIESRDAGENFLYWDGGDWQDLPTEGDFYVINGENVPIAQLQFVYKIISTFSEDFRGFAYARTSGWGDRHIGAGR